MFQDTVIYRYRYSYYTDRNIYNHTSGYTIETSCSRALYFTDTGIHIIQTRTTRVDTAQRPHVQEHCILQIQVFILDRNIDDNMSGYSIETSCSRALYSPSVCSRMMTKSRFLCRVLNPGKLLITTTLAKRSISFLGSNQIIPYYSQDQIKKVHNIPRIKSKRSISFLGSNQISPYHSQDQIKKVLNIPRIKSKRSISFLGSNQKGPYHFQDQMKSSYN